MKKLTGKEYAVLVIEAVILLMLLFGKWLGVESILFTKHTTLLHFGKIVSELSSYVSKGGLTILSILVYVGLIASIISLGFTATALFKPKEERNNKQLWGFYAPSAFAVLIILLVIITNAVIKHSSDGWISGIFGLTATPFLTIVLGVGGLMVYQKLPDASFDSAKDTVKSKVGHVVDVVSKETVVCPSCGAKCKEGTVFCAQCGAKLPASMTHVCSKCGKKLSAGAKFCPDCGTPIEEKAEEDVGEETQNTQV